MLLPSSPLSARLRRSARVGALVVASLGSFVAVTVVDAGSVSAETAELPVNQLAPEITAAASEAVVALEAYRLSGSVEDERTLAWHRAITARYTAQQLGYDELAMVDAWSSAPIGHQRAVLGALTQIGVPYRTNTSIENEGFDCSGITTYAWAGAGVELYRQSGTQIAESAKISREDAKAGDLVHYPGHIMMYLGVDDAIVHSIQTGRTVEIDTMTTRRSVTFGDPTG
ncbi:MAG: NlpC/P60 family protein [Ilumatobacter sp.]|uniref:C40 family peptidase n=1 Tax=Ilumatobacter sp. TaxID=1967498 RepID=UPI003C76E725